MRAYDRLGQYRRGTHFGAWLNTIAVHWCIDYQRREGRLLPLSETYAWLPDSDLACDPEAVVLAAEQRRLVDAWVAALPVGHRQVLLLRHAEGLSYAEIAAQLREPLTAIRMRLHRARQGLVRAGKPDGSPQDAAGQPPRRGAWQ
jgi:RNA polymerase sigma-70 factor (ECF subfamily)